jgi:hypothetical protein
MNAMRVMVSGALLLVAACSPESSTTPVETHGDTVRHNMAVHILPLPPSPAMGTLTEIPGERANVLMDRYMTGKVKEPVNGSSRLSASGGSGGPPGQ